MGKLQSLLEQKNRKELIAYSRKRQDNLLSKYFSNRIPELERDIRQDMAVLRSYSRKLKNNSEEMYLAFQLGELMGTLKSLDQIIYAASLDKQIYSNYAKKVKATDHLHDVLMLLYEKGPLSLTQICCELSMFTKELSVLMKTSLAAELINSHYLGDTIYSLKDTGRIYCRVFLAKTS